MALAEPVQFFFFSTRKAALAIAFMVTLFVPLSAITWHKVPPDPVYGILRENVTLEWNFILTSANESLVDFVLWRDRSKMIQYSVQAGVLVFPPYNGRVGLERNGTSSFILINLEQNDKGTYCCGVTTKVTEQLAHNEVKCTWLKILVRPVIVQISSNQTVNETNDVSVSCKATGTPPPNITWTKAGNEDKILSSSSVLSLQNISREQHGMYWCIADNGLNKAFASISIIVQYKPRATRLTSNATKNIAIEGLPVTFQCTADSVPPSMFEIRFKGLSSGNFSNGKLTIQQVKASDQGRYECIPRNILGSGRKASLNLTVLVPPSIDFFSHNTTVNETDGVTLFCNSTGNPRPNITWLFLSGPEPRIMGTRETLTLTSVERNQAGIYQCMAANNVMNSKTANVRVTINYKPEFKDGASEEIMSWINHETEVICEADGVPVPDIVWSREGMVTSSVQLQSRVSTLRFIPREQSDFGSYICTARNLLGSTKKTIAIKMLVEPEAPEILRIDPGFDQLKIHWKASISILAIPILDYLVQVQEKDEPKGWRNCTQISESLTCVISDLKSDTVYIVRVAGRNAVGYSAFTEKEARTNATSEEGYKEGGKIERQRGLAGYSVDAIIAGVIGFSGLAVVIVAIVTQRRSCHKGNEAYKVTESSNLEAVNCHNNEAFVENPTPDEIEEQV